MVWALAKAYVVFTHDLDLGTMLAFLRGRGPMALQVRTEDILPGQLGPTASPCYPSFHMNQAGTLGVCSVTGTARRMS